MATAAEKQELVDTLKFPPTTVTVSLTGYGGEAVLGTMSREAYDYWSEQDVSEWATTWDEAPDVPESARFCEAGAWYECDDVAHVSGVELSGSCRIIVINTETNDVIWDQGLDYDALVNQGVTLTASGVYDISTQPAGACLFFGQSIEKGTFFEGTFMLTQPFDPGQLEIWYENVADWCIVGGISYAGEEIEGTDNYDTTGKGMEFDVFCNEDPLDIPVLENEEMWTSRVIDENRQLEQ